MASDQFHQVAEKFKTVQDHICNGLVDLGENLWREDLWNYEKGQGGGRTRVWEDSILLEKGGVNYSALHGGQLPPSALQLLPQTLADKPFAATGVSLVLHPWSPIIPTIHMNIRYFECEETYWFGGGIDLTPTYPIKSEIIDFHRTLKKFCDEKSRDYFAQKESCDRYFFLKHRGETRGVGGLFFDHLKGDFARDLDYVESLGILFNALYFPFIRNHQQDIYTEAQREFQLYRRSRYVEFNLLLDRGTHFGIQSEGRTESILMSMPARAHWKYDETPAPGTAEAELIDFYLKPQNWLALD